MKVPYSLRSSRKKGRGRERGKKARALHSLPPTPLPFSMPATQAKFPNVLDYFFQKQFKFI